MLNLFSYGEDDGDEYLLLAFVKCSEKPVKEQQETTAVSEHTDNTKKTEKLSNVNNEKKSKKRKLLNIEKITGVSMDELMKEEEEEEEEQQPSNSEVAKSKLSSTSVLSNLPKPKKLGNSLSPVVNHESTPCSSDENDCSLTSKDESTVSNTQPQPQTPTVTYKTVYRATPSSPSPSSSTTTPNPPITSGYGGNFSQSQYEAFMRRSGMLDTANAESTSSIEFMVECSLLT